MVRPEAPTWGGVARALHWSMAVLIGLQGLLGWIGAEMQRSPLKVDVMTAHKSLGITLLLLVVIRLAWRSTQTTPPPPSDSPRWEVWAAKASHAALYVLIIAMPLSGWFSASTSIVPWKLWWLVPWPSIAVPDRELHEIAEEVHETLFQLLLVMLTIHVAAALQHHFIRHNDVLRRMWRGTS